jgi:hypothetical protein
VQNGQKYFYAVVSYDYGLINYTSEGVEGIAPSECSSIIKTDALGNVTFKDINTGVATPRPYAAGYTPPHQDGEFIHLGPGTGTIELDIVEKHNVPSGATTYEIKFWEDTKHNTESTPYYTIRNVKKDSIVIDSTLLTTVGQETPIFEGTVVNIYNDTSIVMDSQKSRWIEGESDYQVKIRLNPSWEDVAGHRLNLAQPADYKISFYDSVYTQTNSLFGLKSYPSNVRIYNVTDSIEVNYAIIDHDEDEQYSNGDDLVIVVPDKESVFGNYFSWTINFSSKFEVDTSGMVADTTWLTTDPPRPGDQYYLATTKPFRSTEFKIDTVTSGGQTYYDTTNIVKSQGDVFRYTIVGADSSKQKAKQELDDIYVVPNPYVVTASWEPQNPYQFGRGERRIQFFNLPNHCTIRIYTLRGYLVDTIEHHAPADDGMEAWDVLSKDNSEISYGVYIYHVDAPGIGKRIGRFAIIK